MEVLELVSRQDWAASPICYNSKDYTCYILQDVDIEDQILIETQANVDPLPHSRLIAAGASFNVSIPYDVYCRFFRARLISNEEEWSYLVA
jgi:hypothetical protein